MGLLEAGFDWKTVFDIPADNTQCETLLRSGTVHAKAPYCIGERWTQTAHADDFVVNL